VHGAGLGLGEREACRRISCSEFTVKRLGFSLGFSLESFEKRGNLQNFLMALMISGA
jgi:hypothetical protein